MNHGLRKDKREYTREIGLPGNTRHTRKTTAMQRGYAKQGLTQQQRTILRKKRHALRRRRQAVINGTKKVHYKSMEINVQLTFGGPWRMDTICGKVQIPREHLHE